MPRLKPGTVLLREYHLSANTETLFRDQNKAGHGAVSFGILGANRMAVAAPLLRQLPAHTGVAVHDLSGYRMAVVKNHYLGEFIRGHTQVIVGPGAGFLLACGMIPITV